MGWIILQRVANGPEFLLLIAERRTASQKIYFKMLYFPFIIYLLSHDCRIIKKRNVVL